MDTSKEIGRRLGQLRVERDLSQKEVAEKIGMKQQNYAEIELGTGKRHLKDNQLVTLAEFYNVSVDYLLGLIKEKSMDISSKEIYKKYGLTERSLEALIEFKKERWYKGEIIDTINVLLDELLRHGDGSVLFSIDLFLRYFSDELIEIPYAYTLRTNYKGETKRIERTVKTRQQRFVEDDALSRIRIFLKLLKRTKFEEPKDEKVKNEGVEDNECSGNRKE